MDHRRRDACDTGRADEPRQLHLLRTADGNWISVLFGSVAAAALALVVDQLLGLVEAGAARRDHKRMLAGLAALAIRTAVVVAPLTADKPATYVIGSKNFSEQFILSELISQRLQALGAGVERKDGLGSAVIFRALASGELDVYVDYSGTLWANVMGRHDTPSRDYAERADAPDARAIRCHGSGVALGLRMPMSWR